MIVLSLVDKDIVDFNVHFEDEHYDEGYCDTCGGYWESAVTTIGWTYSDGTNFSVDFSDKLWLESVEKSLFMKENLFINWLIINLEDIKTKTAIEFEDLVKNILEDESFIEIALNSLQ